jgi:PucR family transcriptional regulator, purine catabolism regulatory protein
MLMTISCRDVTSVRSLNKIKLVAGQSGLDRVVRWVHFIDLPDVLSWVQGGELLIITGIGLNGDISKLSEIVRGAVQKKLAGLIINIGPYIREIPQDVIILADQLKFPVFELPWEVKLVEVTQDICSYIVRKHTEEKSVSDLLEHILFSWLDTPEVLVQRATYYGIDLTKPQQVVVVRAANLAALVQTKKLQDEKTLVALKVRFERIVKEILAASGIKSLSLQQMDSVILLLQQGKDTRGMRRCADMLEAMLGELALKLPGLDVLIGVGGLCDDLHTARQSYVQANRALRIAGVNKSSRKIHSYEELGIYKLLFEIDNSKLSAYHREVIEPLYLYDDQHQMELVASLFMYFEENGNVAKAAQRLFVHRNTLDYRLKKVEEITGKNLDDVYDRLALQLGLIVGLRLSWDDSADSLQQN